MRDEYDFGGGVRGKYAARFTEGSNVVVLDPDVAAEFKTPQAVNDALRAEIEKRRRLVSGDGYRRGSGRSATPSRRSAAKVVDMDRRCYGKTVT